MTGSHAVSTTASWLKTEYPANGPAVPKTMKHTTSSAPRLRQETVRADMEASRRLQRLCAPPTHLNLCRIFPNSI
jgi:hypothetical protein